MQHHRDGITTENIKIIKQEKCNKDVTIIVNTTRPRRTRYVTV